MPARAGPVHEEAVADVEQIGSVYETVMGFTVLKADGAMIAVKGEKNLPVFVAIDTPRGDPKDVVFVNPADGTAETFIRQAGGY